MLEFLLLLSMVSTSLGEFATSSVDGLPIHYRQWSPSESAPVAILYVVHGMAEHAGRYEDFALELVDKLGISVVAHDQRAHGLTACPPDGPESSCSSLGVLERRPGAERMDAVTLMALDGLSVISHTNLHTLPVFLFGHSMGSVVARAMIRHANDSVRNLISGTVLSGVPTPPGGIDPYIFPAIGYGIKRVGGFGHEFVQKNFITRKFDLALARKLNLKKHFEENFFISSQPSAVQAYNADPLSGHLVDVDILLSVASTLANLQNPADFLALPPTAVYPFLFIAGRDDPVCSFGHTAAIDAANLAALGHAVSEVYLSNCRHEFINEAPAVRSLGIDQVASWVFHQLERETSIEF